MIIERIKSYLLKRRENIINGYLNCIPSPFLRFRKNFPGIEQGKYYLITAAPKVGKTQLSSYFLYNALEEAFTKNDKIRIKIFYFPLEESEDLIIQRYMCYLLYRYKKNLISPEELSSTQKAVDEEILLMLENSEIKSRLEFFEQHVIFSDERNPTGMMKFLESYAKNNGKIIYRKMQYKDTEGHLVIKDKFDHYEANDRNEYVLWFVDHLSLIQQERGMTLRETMLKCSEYAKDFKKKYNYIPVFVQQQGLETTSLQAYKEGKIRPTVAGLSDCKDTAKDVDLMIGLCNPYSFEMDTYCKYPIKDLQGYARILEIVVNRHGPTNGILGVLMLGQAAYFEELPKPDDNIALARVQAFINNLIKPVQEIKNGLLFLLIDKITK